MKFIFFPFLLFSSASFAVLQVEEKKVFYNVAPKSKHTLLSTINEVTPVRNQDGEIFHGYTKYEIRWRVWWKKTADKCQFTKVKTNLSLSYTYPRLKSNDKEIISVWSSWMPKLILHEEGHGEIAKKHAKLIDNILTSMKPETNCRALEKKANNSGYQQLKELDKESLLYDKKTIHGETQDTWLYQHL